MLDAVGLDLPFGNARTHTAWRDAMKSNFLCNLGYGDASKLRPRSPRLAFDRACAIR